MAEQVPLRRTPMYESHVALGGRMVPFAGLGDARAVRGHRATSTRRSGPQRACSTCRTWASWRCAASTPVQVVNYLVTNDASKLDDGQALYTCAATRQGRSSTTSSSTAAPPTAASSSATRRTARRWRRSSRTPPRPLRVRRPERPDRAHRAAGAARPSTILDARRQRRGRRCASSGRFHFRDAVVGERPVHGRAHRVHRRGRRRDLLRVGRRARALDAAPRARAAPRPQARRPRRARHAPARSAPVALRQRDRRDDEPHRGRARLGREDRQGRLRRPAPRSRPSRPRGRSRASSWASRSRGAALPATATRCATSTGREVGVCTSGSPGPDGWQEHRARLFARSR